MLPNIAYKGLGIESHKRVDRKNSIKLYLRTGHTFHENSLKENE